MEQLSLTHVTCRSVAAWSCCCWQNPADWKTLEVDLSGRDEEAVFLHYKIGDGTTSTSASCSRYSRPLLPRRPFCTL